jgi:hypothetical protein
MGTTSFFLGDVQTGMFLFLLFFPLSGRFYGGRRFGEPH